MFVFPCPYATPLASFPCLFHSLLYCLNSAFHLTTIRQFRVFSQSLQKQLNLGGKAGFHSSASTALKNLHETAQHNLAESRYQAIRKAFKTGQLKMGDYDGDDSDADEPKENKAKGDDKESQSESEPTAEENHEERKDKEASASLAKQYKQAVEQVDSLVPINIEAAFSMLESRITVINQSLMYDKSNSLVAWEKVLPALYIQL